jgi:hypothetical protein
MADAPSTIDRTEAAILARIIHPERVDLPDDAAHALMCLLRFDQADLDRMHELAVKNQEESLTPAEKEELESYLRISYFIDLMHAKARLSLKQHAEANPSLSPYAKG